MKYVFSLLIVFHGLVHFMGFAKAFNMGELEELTKEVTKPMGTLWFFTGVLFIISSIFYLLKRDFWPIMAIMAVVVSQILVFIFWKDAKFGSIANAIILIMGILAWASNTFEGSYHRDVSKSFEMSPIIPELVTDEDLAHLPGPVQRYLYQAGVVGKPKVQNFKITFEGRMRDREKDWFTFTSEQHNFIQEPTRFFFMKAKVRGLSTVGYHFYKNGKASMLIRLVSLFPVVKIDGPDLLKTETVTFFNDLCLFAPAALIDDRIQWDAINEQSTKAIFTNNGTTISAILYFDGSGQLVDFVSKDRQDISQMKTFPFSTPIKSYGEINGHKLPIEAEAVWHYPDGGFTYGEFRLKTIGYNLDGPR